MRKVFALMVILVLVVFSVPTWRTKVMLLLFGANPQAIIIQPKSTSLPIVSYASENLNVHIYSISTFIPQMDAFKLKDTNLHYVLLETAIENTSDSTLNPSWFNSTYFLEDNKGHLAHCYMDELTGYYEENHLTKDTSERHYTSKKMPPKAIFVRKYFFFPMEKDAKPAKIHFDDPLTKTNHQFPL